MTISTNTSILLYVVMAIIAVNTYLATTPEIPRFVVIAMGIATVVATVAREQLKPEIQAPSKPTQ